MRIYHYDHVTGEFLGAGSADPSPLEPDVYLIPANATDIAPPECGAGERSVFRAAAWNIEAIPNPEPIPEPTPEEIKARAWVAIKAERDRRKSGGFKVKVGSSNKWFHSDADSRIQHLGLKDMARDLIAGGGAMTDKLTILGQTVKWKTMDGSFVDVSTQVAFDIVAAAGDLDAQLFVAAETHKAAMEASADPASYDYSTGWPKIYGE